MKRPIRSVYALNLERVVGMPLNASAGDPHSGFAQLIDNTTKSTLLRQLQCIPR